MQRLLSIFNRHAIEQFGYRFEKEERRNQMSFYSSSLEHLWAVISFKTNRLNKGSKRLPTSTSFFFIVDNQIYENDVRTRKSQKEFLNEWKKYRCVLSNLMRFFSVWTHAHPFVIDNDWWPSCYQQFNRSILLVFAMIFLVVFYLATWIIGI